MAQTAYVVAACRWVRLAVLVPTLCLSACGSEGPIIRISAEAPKNAETIFDETKTRAALAEKEKSHPDDTEEIALFCYFLGTALYQNHKFIEARSYAQRAIQLFRDEQRPDDQNIAAALNLLARTLWYLDDYPGAKSAIDEAIAIAQLQYKSNLGDALQAKDDATLLLWQLYTLISMAQISTDYDIAIKSEREVIEIVERLVGPADLLMAEALNNLGSLLGTAGEHEAARQQFGRAIAVYKKAWQRIRKEHKGVIIELTDEPTLAGILVNLSSVEWLLGDRVAAQRDMTQAMSLLNVDSRNDFTFINLSQASDVTLKLGMLEQSKQYAKLAIQISEQISEHTTGPKKAYFWQYPFLYLMEIAILQGDQKSADRYYRDLILHAHEATVPRTQADLFSALSRLRAMQGHVAEATFWGKQAVSSLQRLREEYVWSPGQFKRKFLRSKSEIYRGLAELLVSQGRLSEAQEVMVMLKEEEYSDFLHRDRSADSGTVRSSMAPAEQPWEQRYREISGQLAAKGVELERLREKVISGVLTEQEQAQRKGLEQDAEVTRKAFESFLSELHIAFAKIDQQIRDQQPGIENLQYAQALQDTLGKLGRGTVLINYVMGESELYVVLTTPGTQFPRESSKIGFKALSAKLFAFKSAIEKSKGIGSAEVIQTQAAELYELLIRPIQTDLEQAEAVTLMVSLDGPLRYLPISALYDQKAKQYLVERYALAIFTEAARDKLKDTAVPGGWKVAGLGLTDAVPDFKALPGVKDELEGIVRESDQESGVLPGRRFLNDQFTAEALQAAADQAQYPVVHVASHFRFRVGSETESFLVLGNGKHFTVEQLKGLKFTDKDLLTLSACETAVGGGLNAQGVEIEGLGALAQKQQAKAVIATLWKVSDLSTGKLMQNFYRERTMNNLNKAEALKRAQLQLLKGDGKGTAPYAHPYYWAPFILMGNWR